MSLRPEVAWLPIVTNSCSLVRLGHKETAELRAIPRHDPPQPYYAALGRRRAARHRHVGSSLQNTGTSGAWLLPSTRRINRYVMRSSSPRGHRAAHGCSHALALRRRRRDPSGSDLDSRAFLAWSGRCPRIWVELQPHPVDATSDRRWGFPPAGTSRRSAVPYGSSRRRRRSHLTGDHRVGQRPFPAERAVHQRNFQWNAKKRPRFA
jgi:hypothetical protein